LGKKENLPILRKLVRFHVHQELGTLTKEDLDDMVGRELSTLALLPVNVKAGSKINEARITRDLPLCSNGKVFEVDNLVSTPLLFRFLV